MKRIFTSIALLLLGVSLNAQSGKAALKHLHQNFADYGLEEMDVRDLRVTDAYSSPNGVKHVYIDQYFQGIPIEGAQAILHFKGDRLAGQTINLHAQLDALGLPAAPTLSGNAAAVIAARKVAPAFGHPTMTEKRQGTTYYSWPAVSDEPLAARLMYHNGERGVQLIWNVLISRHAETNNYYAVTVDATTGEVLQSRDLVLHCSFNEEHQAHDLGVACAAAAPLISAPPVALIDSATYRVWPFGVESPNHGDREYVVNPADSVASPYGWHDVDGQPGPEYTITRGNNAYAYPDRGSGVDNDDEPDGEVADGGEELYFDFPFSPTGDPDTILQAALVQSFYSVNSIHDWLYHHGFDEASGNFQQNNYGRGGAPRDALNVEVQDGTGLGNANFFTLGDGNTPRMQMMLFSGASSDFAVLSPLSIAGSYEVGLAQFGANIQQAGPFQGRVVVADDGSALGNEACGEIINPAQVANEIALISRGTCSFSQKVFNAEEAGAVGVIICNNQPNQLVTMQETAGFPVTIPSVFLSMESCALLRAELEEGEIVTVRFESFRSPPLDSDFDAGIVTHEYGHGVSIRLVGGPSNAGCLNNDEQMGEGWSDFFGLASTPFTNTDDPDGSERRGIGTYAGGQEVNGGGIRTQPYSTDRSINTKTYQDVNFTGQGTAPHPVGEIWASVLWDIYWYFTNKYGLDPDLINGSGGNNRAVQLVVEGMKYTKCNPGMLDARDGILMANELLYDGLDQCELYSVFAARGMGYSAIQGSTHDRTDNSSGYDITPYCNQEIRLTKESSEASIDAGDEVEINLIVRSFREGETPNLVITDTIPEGMGLIPNSLEGDYDSYTQEGNVLTWTINEISLDEVLYIDYSVTTNPETGSTSFFLDDAESFDNEDNWNIINVEGTYPWSIQDTTPFMGGGAYYVVNGPETNDQLLQIYEAIELQGDQPALRFWTQYNTEPGWDAGIIELSTDGTSWQKVTDDMLARGKFRGLAADNALEPLRGSGSFWGNSVGYQEIIVDLSEFAGQEIFFRFRFLSDANTSGRGWWVDNIELLDVVNYDGGARLSYAGGESYTKIGNLGVVAYGGNVSADDAELGQTSVEVFPNPAGDLAHVRILTERAGSANVQLLNVNGQVVFEGKLPVLPGANQMAIPTERFAPGMYIVQVTGAERVSTTKLTIR